MHGDCLDLMKQIPDGSVDMILTDPPYGVTRLRCEWDEVIPFEPMWAEIWRTLKPNGACLLFGSEPFSSRLRCSALEFFKYDWVWNKMYGANFIKSNTRPLKHHELISVFYRQQPTYNKQMVTREKTLDTSAWSKKRSGSNVAADDLQKTNTKTYDQKNPNSVITISSISAECNHKNRVHPTQKPVALLEYLIKTYTNEGETVLDFTMGSGSTGVACRNTDRKFIGIEKDAKYFEIAQQRIQETEGLFFV
jgi:site-specific DNA-methyltransferase (adenine-specific)